MSLDKWIVLAAAVISAGVVVTLYLTKRVGKDKAVSLLATVTLYVRKAEGIITGEKQGAAKKALVMEYLQELFGEVKNDLLSNLIDLVVAILNTMGWW